MATNYKFIQHIIRKCSGEPTVYLNPRENCFSHAKVRLKSQIIVKNIYSIKINKPQ